MTRLADAGLVYEATIGPAQRETSCLNLADTFAGIGDILARLAQPPPTRVVLDAATPSVKGLGVALQAAQRRDDPNGAINVTHGLPARSSGDGPFTRLRCVAPE